MNVPKEDLNKTAAELQHEVDALKEKVEVHNRTNIKNVEHQLTQKKYALQLAQTREAKGWKPAGVDQPKVEKLLSAAPPVEPDGGEPKEADETPTIKKNSKKRSG